MVVPALEFWDKVWKNITVPLTIQYYKEVYVRVHLTLVHCWGSVHHATLLIFSSLIDYLAIGLDAVPFPTLPSGSNQARWNGFPEKKWKRKCQALPPLCSFPDAK